MNMGKVANLESTVLVPWKILLDHVIKMRASCFDTDFVSQMKLTTLPLIHCFVLKWFFEFLYYHWTHFGGDRGHTTCLHIFYLRSKISYNSCHSLCLLIAYNANQCCGKTNSEFASQYKCDRIAILLRNQGLFCWRKPKMPHLSDVSVGLVKHDCFNFTDHRTLL